jgi:hypothetical protein
MNHIDQIWGNRKKLKRINDKKLSNCKHNPNFSNSDTYIQGRNQDF